MVWSSLSRNERRVARLIGFEQESFGVDQLQEVHDLLSGAKEMGIKHLNKLREVAEIREFLDEQASQNDVLDLKSSSSERRVAKLAGFNLDLDSAVVWSSLSRNERRAAAATCRIPCGALGRRPSAFGY